MRCRKRRTSRVNLGQQSRLQIPPTYLRLAERWPPHPIADGDEADYWAAVAVLDPLATRVPETLGEGERWYLEALAAFIEDYDRRHFAEPATTFPERVQHLLDEQGLTWSQLAELVRTDASTIGDVLAGRQRFTLEQVAVLAERFRTDPEYFSA